MSPIATRASNVGLGKESTYGTAVAPTIFPPVTSMSPQEVRNYAPVSVMTGSFVDIIDQIATQGWSTYAYEAPMEVTSIGPALKSLFGEEAVTGTGPYTHAFDVLNTGAQPPSYTIQDWNGVNARRYPGSLCGEITVTFAADGLLTYSTSWIGLSSATATQTAASFSATDKNFAGYTGTITIAGTGTGLVQSGTVTLTRNIVPILAINNSTSPAAIFGAGVSATASLVVLYNDDAFYTPFLAGTTQSFDLSWTQGSGASTQTFTVHGTKGLTTQGTPDRGDEWVKLNLDVSLVGNATDVGTSAGYSPVKTTIVNAQSTAF